MAKVFQAVLENGEKMVQEHYDAIRRHIGPVYLERSGDEVVGCCVELIH